MILGLKLGRRLLAACALDEEQFTFRDSRFVTSRRVSEDVAFVRYIRQLVGQVHPHAIYFYAPTVSNTRTERLIALLETTAAEMGLPAKPLSRLDVFGSFGLLPMRTRHDLREQIAQIWPLLTEEHSDRQVALAEATATALVGDLRQRWPPV